MSIFNPEQILMGMIQRMGITQADIVQVVQLVGKLQALMSEVDGFKAGSVHMVSHFNARLDRIEARLERYERPPETAPNHPVPNGITYVRNDE